MDEQKSQIDFIVRLFQTGMKKVESLAVKLDDSIKDFETQKQKNAELLKSFDSVNAKRNVFEEIVSIKLNVLQDNTLKNASLFIEVNNKIEEEKKSILALTSFANIEREKLSQLSQSLEKLPKFSDLESIKTGVLQLNKLVEQNQKICQDTYLKLSNEIAEFKTVMADCQQNLQLLKSSAERKDGEISKLRSDLETIFKQLNDKINSVDAGIVISINNAVNAIPKPVIPRIEDAQKAFSAQLEPVVLDAKNASLRAVNNETKISILERKIDQLQLLLNKLQMQE